MNLRAIIVDDEPHARIVLKNLIKLEKLPVDIIAEFDELPALVKFLNTNDCDVVFMDIDMPKYTGLQLADFVENFDFKLVYITAHSNFVLEALRIKAFDYLIKPLDSNELQKCIERIKKEISINDKNEPSKPLNQISINSLNGIEIIKLENILYFEASSMYTLIFLESGKEIVVSKPLKEYDFLNDHGFFRTHRSFMVNMNKVLRYVGNSNEYVETSNGNKIPVARNRKDEFLKRLKNL